MQREVAIGVDFGTATSKIGFGSFGEDDARIVPTALHRAVLWPSAVGLDSDRAVYFADGLPEAVTPHRWLKLSLGHKADAGHERRRRQILATFGLPVEAMCAAFVALCIREAKEAARRAWPRDELFFTCNLGAPLDDLSLTEVRSRYDMIGRAGFSMARHARQRWPLDELAVAWRDAESEPVPAEEDRLTFVIPETHAAHIGILLDRTIPEGHFASIDIGAGTTDIAIFRYVRSTLGSTSTDYFIDRSVPTASYSVDFGLARAIYANTPGLRRPSSLDELILRVQRAKEHTSDTISEIPGWHPIRPERAQSIAGRIALSLGAAYRRIFSEGYQKHKLTAAWTSLNVIALGGGSRFKPFGKMMTEHPLVAGGQRAILAPDMRIMPIELCYEGLLQVVPDQVDLPAGMAHRFNVLYGLTRHRALMPDYFLPAAVPAFEQKFVPQVDGLPGHHA